MHIGKYEVKRVLAEGLFADVYEALEPAPPRGLGRRVVVKLCSTSDESVRQRFALETKMIARLGDHPNITSAYDMGYEGQSPFLVEEYVSGEDLRQKIARRDDIPLTRKVEYLLQLAKGLDFAHSKGIVHRDIKPENVRISDHDHVKIMDFGIGKIIASEATRLTASGAIVGTLGYLSPEQIRGEADERSDVFAFAVVAYELLTYEHPFPAKSLRQQLQIVMTSEAKPLRELFPDCPADLAALVGRALDKSPDKRPQAFREIVDRLRRILVRLRHDSADAVAQTVVLADGELQEVLSAVANGARAEAPSDGDATADEATVVAGEPGPQAPEPRPPAATAAPATGARPAAAAAPGPTPGERLARLAAAFTAALSALGRRATGIARAVSGRVGPALQGAADWARGRRAAVVAQLPRLRAAVSGLPRWALPAVAGVALLIALGLVFALLRSPAPPATDAEEAVALSEPPAEPPPPVIVPSATVFVDAFPWAEVSRVTTLDDVAIAEQPACVTPCLLELAPGTYRIALTHPDHPQRQEACEVDALSGQTADCRARFEELTPRQYFRRAGWWQ